MDNTAQQTVPAAGVVVPGRELHLVLDGLKRWYSRVSNPGPRSILGLLTGEAGLGKSLIVRSVQQACDSLEIRWASARCPKRATEPLGVILDWIDQLFEEEQVELNEIEKSLLAHLASDQEVTQAVDRRLKSLSAGLDRSRTVDALACMILKIANGKPLVLFLEDLQWIDGASLETLIAMARIARQRSGENGSQLLLIASCRPSELSHVARACELLKSRHVSFEVSFRGYSRDDLRDASTNFLKDQLPLSLREELYQRASGNLRLVHWALRSARPGRRPGTFNIYWPHGQAPFQLAELLELRYKKLLPVAKSVLALFSSTARPLSVDQLNHLIELLGSDHPLYNQSPNYLAKVCYSLEQEGWLCHQGRNSDEIIWSVNGPEVADWLEDASESTMDIHTAFGKNLLQRSVQDQNADWIFEALYHLEKGNDAQARLDAGFLAAELAERRGAFNQALEIRDRILEDLEVLPSDELIPVCESQARLLELAEVYREAIDIYRSLADGHMGVISPEDHARYCLNMGQIYRAMQAHSQEAKAYEEGIQAVEPPLDGPCVWDLSLALARNYWERGRRRESEKIFHEVTQQLLAKEGEIGSDHLGSLRLAQENAYCQGDLELAFQLESRRFELSRLLGKVEDLAESAQNLSQLHCHSGETEKAEDFLFEALDAARKSGSRCLEARLEAEHGRLLRGRRMMSGAVSSLERSRRMLNELGLEEETTPIVGDLLFEKLKTYTFVEALTDLRTFVRLKSNSKNQVFVHSVFPPVYQWSRDREEKIAEIQEKAEASRNGLSDSDLRHLGDLLLESGKTKEAWKAYKEVMKSPKVSGNPIAMALTLQRLGRWMRLNGHYSDALQRYEKSLEYLGPVLEKSILGKAYIEVGELLTIQGNLKVGYNYLLRALRIFLELDDPLGLCESFLGLAKFYNIAGMNSEAEAFSQCAAEVSHNSGLIRIEAEASRVRGYALWRLGRSEESRQALMRAGQLFERLGLERGQSYLKHDRAWMAYHSNDFERAIDLARSALEWAREVGDQTMIVDALHLVGAIDGHPENRNKNFLRSTEALQQALEGAKAHRRALTSRWILQTLAGVYEGKGKSDFAREYVVEEAAVLKAINNRVQIEFWEEYSREARLRAGNAELLKELEESLV